MSSSNSQLQNKDSTVTTDIKPGAINADVIACIDCDKIFKSDEAFFLHGKICQSLKNCPFCSRKRPVGSTVKHLYKHVKKSHASESETVPFRNIVDEYALYLQSAIERVQCDKCGNYYANPQSLDNHIRDRHGNESFICSICGSSFRSKRDLESHSVTHNKATIPCDQCDQVYKKRTFLNRHIKVVHMNIKNHGCDLCDKRFRSTKALNEHKTAIHDKLKPFACLKCDFRCAKYFNLNLHRERKHVLQKMLKTEYDDLVAKGEHPFLGK